MNVANRLFVAMVLLALAVVAVSISVLAWTIPLETIDFLRDGVDWLEEHNGETEKAILSVMAVGFALAVLALIAVELWPRGSKGIKVTDLHSGTAVISADAVGQRLGEAVMEVPHVSEVKTLVRPRRKGVEVEMDLHVDADANLAEVSDAASEAVRDALANRMHVALARPPMLRLHYRELRLRRPAEPPALANERIEQNLISPPPDEAFEEELQPSTVAPAPSPGSPSDEPAVSEPAKETKTA